MKVSVAGRRLVTARFTPVPGSTGAGSESGVRVVQLRSVIDTVLRRQSFTVRTYPTVGAGVVQTHSMRPGPVAEQVRSSIRVGAADAN
jgi:hypothetical protein